MEKTIISDLNLKNSQLMAAIKNQDAILVKNLIEQGADVNALNTKYDSSCD